VVTRWLLPPSPPIPGSRGRRTTPSAGTGTEASGRTRPACARVAVDH